MAFPGGKPDDAVDLTDAINAVHEQLTAAIRNVRENDVLGFEYGDVEIELQMIATQSVGAEGGVRFYVFTASGTVDRGVVG
jgi:Trypsin-co-occurring domain 2